jgi:RNA-binding protein
MRFHWLRARAFVHATEDEQRVQETLLWLVAQDENPRAYGQVHRQRTKGHYGNEILLLEASLKKAPDVEAALARLLSEPGLRAQVTETLLRRLDEDHVLHLRLDKQAAVGRRVQLSEGSDAVVVTVKTLLTKDEVPARAWAERLRPAA